MAEEVRLQKYISDCGIMSRRAAEKEIEKGLVTVNGEPAELGQKIVPGRDIVMYNGIKISRSGDRKLYIMLNKPAGYLTSMSDDRGRKCVSELVADLGERVYPCGRLDLESEGMLIMTNDGEMANKLTHPGHNFSKLYHVKIDTIATPEIIAALSEPMIIDGYKIQPVKVKLVTHKRDCSILSFELYEGRNRQIRKMCENVGIRVKNLRRVSVGELQFNGLEVGQWRFLTASEIRYLKKVTSENNIRRKKQYEEGDGNA